ncbi:methyltransferase [Microbotryomycetes sp. JL201]|nr:methyltransferase [Microbotryomycetes sp. JL201]
MPGESGYGADTAQQDVTSLIERIKADRQAKYPYANPFVPICRSGTRSACPEPATCRQAHFVKILRKHTLESLGDCSYLNTCHRTGTCRYVHYQLEDPGRIPGNESAAPSQDVEEDRALPAEWINADLRTLDLSVLGKFDVVVADPPWAIHQEASRARHHEMLHMQVGTMQNEGGLLFLWVTGRAMELGRECLAAWGYERIDEVIWVKMNQLQGLIRTGRTGHWLNHSKEHCIVAIRKSSEPSMGPPRMPEWYTRGIDTQVIVSEVRETSRKPDELYDMVERILGGRTSGRKVELFGRKHNIRPGWLTIGNQLGEADQVFDSQLVDEFNQRLFTLVP